MKTILRIQKMLPGPYKDFHWNVLNKEKERKGRAFSSF